MRGKKAQVGARWEKAGAETAEVRESRDVEREMQEEVRGMRGARDAVGERQGVRGARKNAGGAREARDAERTMRRGERGRR